MTINKNYKAGSEFRTIFGQHIFENKYQLTQGESWHERAKSIVRNVCGRGENNEFTRLMAKDDCDQLVRYISDFKFIPGGRYIWYSGRSAKFFNNCYLLRAEADTREEWADLARRATSCLMTGGGIGIDYSRIRGRGNVLRRTGGISSGPIPLMYIINEIGRNVMQGGSRRSAIYASLNWQHEDVEEFLHVKDWQHKEIQGLVNSGDGGTNSYYTLADAKRNDFNFPCPLDMTNISLNYDNEFLNIIENSDHYDYGYDIPDTFIENCRQALSTSEPGFSFNFGAKENETLRNACTEVTSEDDSDVCNLGSVNIAACKDLDEFQDVVDLASRFLVCGTVRAELPYQKVYDVRNKNRRLGLGLMGLHEWLLMRGYSYEVNDELKRWLEVYRSESERSATEHCSRYNLSTPKAFRAIAPTGSIGIIAGTTTGIEPLFAVAYKRRYLADGTRWKYEYVIDSTAQHLIDTYDLKPEAIETSMSLAFDYERRIKFQADIQDYVDMSISSTINLPRWGSDHNNPDLVLPFAETLAKYAPRLRGFTCYADNSRGGQPITQVDYYEALKHKGAVYEESSELQCKSGVCGI